jgi:hypothetical protein
MARRTVKEPFLDKRTTPPTEAAPTRDDPAGNDIGRRAYVLYEARGGEPGSEVDDWLRAEQELRVAGDGDAGNK